VLEFLKALGDPHSVFLVHALAAGLLVSVSCGIIGSYVVTRRITYIAGGIAHFVLGGIGAANYFRIEHGLEWLNPFYGALFAALLAAVIIGLVSLRSREREDTVIGALWAIGMAVGVLFLSQTSQYAQNLQTYLFGNILLTGREGPWLIFGLDALVLVMGLLFYNPLLAVCFDEECARLRGVPVEAYYLMLLGLTALTVVLLASIVGVVMVIALLTLPAAIAGRFSRRLWQMMAIAVALCACFTTFGLAFSYSLELPTGATTVLLAGAAYILVILAGGVWKRLRKGVAKNTNR